MIPDTGPCGTDGMTRDSLRRELDAALARVGVVETALRDIASRYREDCEHFNVSKDCTCVVCTARSALDGAKEGT